jgi:hypothetical protein
VLLVLRVNQYLGLPDVIFAVGDNALQYFVSGVSYMPMAIMVSDEAFVCNIRRHKFFGGLI